MAEYYDHFDLPKIEIVDEDPPEGWREAVEVAMEDLRAGRYVVCDLETFDRLLTGAPSLAEAG